MATKELKGEDKMDDITYVVNNIVEQLIVRRTIEKEEVQELSDRVAKILMEELKEILPDTKILINLILCEKGDCGLSSTNCNRWDMNKDYMHNFDFDALNYKCFVTVWTLPL